MVTLSIVEAHFIAGIGSMPVRGGGIVGRDDLSVKSPDPLAIYRDPYPEQFGGDIVRCMVCGSRGVQHGLRMGACTDTAGEEQERKQGGGSEFHSSISYGCRFFALLVGWFVTGRLVYCGWAYGEDEDELGSSLDEEEEDELLEEELPGSPLEDELPGRPLLLELPPAGGGTVPGSRRGW